jgi:ATP-dependent helicase/nuclease subunit A
MSARITLVGASAGTGKTYRLGTALLDAVRAGTPPQNVLATTFTNRAAAELISRGRDRLLSGDLPQQALNLMLARIGTVNAVFGGILADFALQNGRSPVVSVIPDAAQASVLRTAAAPCIRKHAPELDRLAEKFEFFQAKANWIDILTALAAAARSNGIAPANLEASASRSLSTLLKAFPDEVGSATALAGC